MRVTELVKFIKERESVRLKKEAGKPKPWTKDPILQKYKFCNIRREDDRVSRWIAENWREPNKDDPNIWFAMTLARLVNWPSTLEAIGYPHRWAPAAVRAAMLRRAARGEKVYTGAYMLRGDIQKPSGEENDKPLYTCKILEPMWKARKQFDAPIYSLQQIFNMLKNFAGMGDFIAGQVIADIKYTPRFGPEQMVDWEDFAAMGPGSKRGLNRVVGREPTVPWREDDWQATFLELREKTNTRLMKAWTLGFPVLHAQDLQNCLCEFDKYERVRLGEGRPRSLYDGA